jgi:hypothetical protein
MSSSENCNFEQGMQRTETTVSHHTDEILDPFPPKPVGTKVHREVLDVLPIQALKFGV